MRELYVEGVATHDGPESCASIREGGGEAWDRGTNGPGIEPRNSFIQGAEAVPTVRRQYVVHRKREVHDGPARSETPSTFGTFLCENREICGSLVATMRRDASGRVTCSPTRAHQF